MTPRHAPVLEPHALVETQQPPHHPGSVAGVVVDKERKRAVYEVKLGFVYRR